MSFLLHQLATKSAQRDATRLAVVGATGTLTYGELERLSNQIARALIDLGVKPGDRVGLFMNKCVECIAALLAVQKAGAAYVPIDPHAPSRRAGYILGDCAVRCVIGGVEKVAKLPDELFARPELAGLILHDDRPPGGAHGEVPLPASAAGKKVSSIQEIGAVYPGDPVDVPITDNHLAYILYTSGSTGEPKGVMISHLNALTFVNWCQDTFRLTPDDRVSSHAPLHFDLSVFDIFCTLKAGATIYLVPNDLAIFPARLARWIAESGLTAWYSVPSALIQLVEHGKLDAASVSALRLVLFAGEVFPIKYLRRLIEVLPSPAYYNLYGPTETNVCTYYRVVPGDLDPARTEPVPIGRACENTCVMAIDESGEVAPLGAVGELCVQSSTVMKGYWGRSADTAKGLAQNPTNPHYADALYRTGDLVRELPSGDYQYLGRKDKMIKSRGYRIELGEIEAALLAHPGVTEAAVVAIADEQIGARIRAFVAAGEGVAKQALEKLLSERLPRYMMPEKIEIRAALPRTSTGKIDRALLERESTGG